MELTCGAELGGDLGRARAADGPASAATVALGARQMVLLTTTQAFLSNWICFMRKVGHWLELGMADYSGVRAS